LINNNIHIDKINCSGALKKLRRKIPYGWDLNIYGGCSHGCRYCYALSFHGENDPSKVIVKTNIVEQLDKELSDPSWKREVINIGGTTDSYQQAEAEFKIMPDVLKVMIRHRNPAIISTKSDLILRDYDLIAELSGLTYVNIASTIITMDEEVRRKIEPYCSRSSDRFRMLAEFRETNASTGLHTMPIIPYLTDGYSNIDLLCHEAARAGVHYMLPGVLYLRGKTREKFFQFVKQSFPGQYQPLLSLYKKGGADRAYKERLYSEIVNPLRNKYGLSGSYMKPLREKMHS
jgi:DNA repair photolyase